MEKLNLNKLNTEVAIMALSFSVLHFVYFNDYIQYNALNQSEQWIIEKCLQFKYYSSCFTNALI